MLCALLEGTLTSAPASRTSGRGTAFVTAQMRVPTEGGDSILVSVIAFSQSAGDALLDLQAGDSVAVTGPATVTTWEKNGEHRTGLNVTASRVMTVYEAGQRRKAAGQARGTGDES